MSIKKKNHININIDLFNIKIKFCFDRNILHKIV